MMPVQWRYHLGVHKTATTHIQRVLESQRAELLTRGIDYIPLEELRSRTEPIFSQLALKRSKFNWTVRSSARAVILSEENWLGLVQDACAWPLYANLEKRLAVVARPSAPAFLSVRNPADFAASAYSEALRHAPGAVSLERTRDAFMSATGMWIELVRRVQRFFPNLRIWRYEDYRGNESGYISLLAGAPLCTPALADPPETKRLSAETVASLEAIRTTSADIPKAGTLSVPPRATRFEIFSETERAELTARYECDLELLQKDGLLIDAKTLQS